MSTLPRPSAILFDVGNTLLEEQRFDLETGIAAVVPHADRVRELATAFRRDSEQARNRGVDLLLARWLQQHEATLAHESVWRVESRVWSAVVTLRPRPHVEAMLAHLASDGLALAAVSNAAFSCRVLTAELERHGLACFLRFVLTSADAGSRKPEPFIFARAVERLGTQRHGVWFVGDTPSEDIGGAVAAGLRAVLFSPSGVQHSGFNDVPVVRDWSEFLALYART